MEWHIMNVGGLSSVGGSFGSIEDDCFVPSDDCEDLLHDLNRKLNEEDISLCQLRRQVFYSRLVEKDLIPMVKHLQDDPSIFSESLKLMSNLTQPIECLMSQPVSDVHVMFDYNWSKDIQKSLRSYKKLSCDKDLIHAIACEIRTVLDESDGYELSTDGSEVINHMLLFLRNVLHYSEFNIKERQEYDEDHKDFLRVLFETKITDVILRLLQSTERKNWCVPLVQLISLLYKGKIGELLYRNFFCNSADVDLDIILMGEECSLCGLEQKCGQCQCMVKLEEDFSSPSHIMVSPEQMKTSSSNGSPQRSRSNSDGSDNQRHENDMLWKSLEDFTQSFFMHGFCDLVHDLKQFLISKNRDVLDDAYFLWMIAFFHKLARYKKIPFTTIRTLYSTEIISFLVYEGVITSEQVLFARKRNFNLSRKLRRLHLTVGAIRELLLGLKCFSEDSKLDSQAREYLETLQRNLANLYDLRQFFLLLIQQFESNTHSIKYLQEVVVANHIFLLMMDTWNSKGFCRTEFKMVDHIQQFSSVEVMKKYGRLLEQFEFNNALVNNCVFTMMHHIAGDCGHPESLFQVQILTTFLHIWDHCSNLTQEMTDLMDFVLQRFMMTAETDPFNCAQILFGGSDSINQDVEERIDDAPESVVSCKTEWTMEEGDLLFMLYMELKDESSIITRISERFTDMGINKTEKEISEHLLELNLLSLEDGNYSTDDEQTAHPTDDTDGANVSMTDETESIFDPTTLKETDVVPLCIKKLQEDGYGCHLKWLKRQLCEIAFAKFAVEQYKEEGKGMQEDGEEEKGMQEGREEKKEMQEPVARFCAVQENSIPLVLFSEEQEQLLHNKYFSILLQYLGLYMPNNVDMLYPRVPHFWSAKQAVGRADLLESVSKDDLKFDLANLKDDLDIDKYTNITEQNMEEDMDKSTGCQCHKNIPDMLWMSAIHKYNNKVVGN